MPESGIGSKFSLLNQALPLGVVLPKRLTPILPVARRAYSSGVKAVKCESRGVGSVPGDGGSLCGESATGIQRMLQSPYSGLAVWAPMAQKSSNLGNKTKAECRRDASIANRVRDFDAFLERRFDDQHHF